MRQISFNHDCRRRTTEKISRRTKIEITLCMIPLMKIITRAYDGPDHFHLPGCLLLYAFLVSEHGVSPTSRVAVLMNPAREKRNTLYICYEQYGIPDNVHITRAVWSCPGNLNLEHERVITKCLENHDNSTV